MKYLIICMLLVFSLQSFFCEEVKDNEYIEKLSSSVLKDLAQMKKEIIEEYRNDKEFYELELAHNELLLSRQKIIMHYYIIIFVLLVIFLSIVLYQIRMANRSNRKLEKVNENLNKANSQLTKLATTDPLTNLSNRRDMLTKIEYEQQRFDRNGKPFVLLMADVDDFKLINDKYGHDGGDFVLKSIAVQMKSVVRKQDIVGRWGGEEFLLLLPDTGLEGGKALADKIQSNISMTPYLFSKNKIPVTITFGVAVYDRKMIVDNCIKIADRALYRGKRNGKNCVVVGEFEKDTSDYSSELFFENDINSVDS